MNLGDCTRVDESRRPHLNRGAACDQELERVFGAHDAADPDHRDAHRSRRLVREVHCQRTNGRAGQAARPKAQPRLSRIDVDRHAHESVDCTQRVRAGGLAGAGDDADVRHHRSQLHPHRQISSLAYGVGHRSGGARIVAEVKSALLDIRTRDVDLETGHTSHAVEPRGQLAIFRRALAIDVHEDGEVPLRPLRRVVADQPVDARTLEADRVEHAGRGLGDARRRRAGSRSQEDAFGDNRAKRTPLQQRHLSSVAERSRSGENRSSQFQVADLDRHVETHALIAYCRCDGSIAHSMSAARYTGPSLHARSYPPRASGTAQPRHTPVPQPMYVSTATCASGHRDATPASIRLGPQASTRSTSGTAATAVPAKPRVPSSVAQMTSSPSASEHRSSALRAPCTHITCIPAARASRAASSIGATPRPPLTSATERGPGDKSKPCPRGPRQLMIAPASIRRSCPVPAPTALRTTSMWSPSVLYTENGRRSNGPPAQPRLTNWPARTDCAISGASIVTTNMPRATSRRPTKGASTRNTGPPLLDGADLHLVRHRRRRFEQRRRCVER